MKITIPSPDLQIDFSFVLEKIRNEYLQEALGSTIKEIDIRLLDTELGSFVSKEDLVALASRGLRGELLFPVPSILAANPKLLGYYRLLLGFSQKTFYSSEFGTSAFKKMEENGNLTPQNRKRLRSLCRALITSSSKLLSQIGMDRITKDFLDDLTLLTLGPQLKGGANVKKGTAGIEIVFQAIYEIVKKYCLSSNPQSIKLKNAAKRLVLIEFAPDPDIIIREMMAEKLYRNIIAIEIKGGTDFSNIHNRLGEAEKSHQKARQAGFVECWTVVNVDRIDLAMARKESPSTNRFYRISQVVSKKGEEYGDFRNRVISLTGIPNR
jgi:hypothetical protein